MKYRVTITFKTADKVEDDAEFVVEVEALSRDQACEMAARQVRADHSVGASAAWHCSTEQLPPEL